MIFMKKVLREKKLVGINLAIHIITGSFYIFQRNLSKLLNLTLTVQEVKERILTALLDGQCELLESEINFATEASYQKAMDRLNLRKV